MSETALASVTGYSPTVAVQVRTEEQAKYESMWTHDAYREVAPGESTAPLFLEQARPARGSTVIDFGAGTGRGALMLAFFGGVKVRMIDFAGNCLDPEVRQALTTQAHALDFTQHDLTKPVPFSERYGYCTDVMEHIPPEDVDQVLANILQAAQHVFFQISCEDDVCGKLIGKPLHLSVHPFEWWLKKLQSFDCVVHWSADYGSHCCFYVTAWQSGQVFSDIGTLNVEDDELRANVETNAKGGWQQVQPYESNDFEVMIVGGGPTLNEHLETIRQLRSEGAKLVTLNGAYNWALEHGLKVSAQIVVDGREFNKRFTKPVQDETIYLIASQCNPAVYEGLPKERTYQWHTSAETVSDILDAHLERWYAIPGGSTVLLRAIPLLRMLGYRKFHLFGCDSCVGSQNHHAYQQPENDGEVVIDTIVGDRVFQCHAWHVAQAQQFIDLVEAFHEEIDLEIYGDGLLRHIVTTGAEIADHQERV